MSGEILVLNVRRGAEPVVIVCDVLVGDFKLCGVTLRRGRGQATYVNLPRQWRDGHWSPAVEITAPDLFDQVRHAVVMAAVEQTRYSVYGG